MKLILVYIFVFLIFSLKFGTRFFSFISFEQPTWPYRVVPQDIVRIFHNHCVIKAKKSGNPNAVYCFKKLSPTPVNSEPSVYCKRFNLTSTQKNSYHSVRSHWPGYMFIAVKFPSISRHKRPSLNPRYPFILQMWMACHWNITQYASSNGRPLLKIKKGKIDPWYTGHFKGCIIYF